jgi:hypothetical protein
MSVGRCKIETSQRKTKRNTKSCYQTVIKMVLTNGFFREIINYQQKLVIKSNSKEAKMEKVIPTVGSQFTTAKSGVSGVVQEVIENKTGSFRVRLDVNGQPRWTTVK